MKKSRKVFKFLFIFFIILTSFTLMGSITYYHLITHSVSLDQEKLQTQNPIETLTIYDSANNKIKPTKDEYINLSKLSSKTKYAFLCAEDKRFYKHKGLDFLRIGGAILSNLKTQSFSEGASTISQQLVKNTQLSNEKTISRKLKEIKLTKQLEKKYTKDEILELYLNNIYFGNGCYGIENASKHYFSKSSSNLSLAESALLAGVINAPSLYDIESNLDKAIERRNLILKLMLNYEKISKAEFDEAKSSDVNLKISDISGNYNLYKNISTEACEILNIDEKILNGSNYKIYTSIDNDINNFVKTTIKKDLKNAEIATIVIDNKKHQIIAIQGKNNILNNPWQPGSTIKPILVYAPAIEKNIITPETQILDNKIDFNGYSPENSDKKYHGFITTKTALSKSYNIPAVKLLNEIGISTAKEFAQKLEIPFEHSDNHLALALGGFEKGILPKTLCDAYSAFANNGKFSKSKYINKITKNGKLIYELNPDERIAMRIETASMINEMLLECSKSGTAKRLHDLQFSVCSKTGTVGNTNSSENHLAYNIAYTTNHTILTIIQGKKLSQNINGSTLPTIINKEILSKIYINKKPQEFKITPKPNINQNIQNNKELLPHEYTNKNQTEISKLTAINSKHSNPTLCFTSNKNYNYYLIRINKNKEETIFSSLQNDNNLVKFTDKTAKNNTIYTYKLKICEKTTNKEYFSNEITLKTY